MGSIKKAKWEYRWVPVEFMAFVAKSLNIDTFVETGTEEGLTSAAAARVFKNVYTCEASEVNFKKGAQLFMEQGLSNITHVQAESIPFLQDWVHIHPEGKAMYWLDAHWTWGVTRHEYYGQHTPQPLIDELRLINSRLGENFIFIDDMRFFVYPFTPPEGTIPWPSLREIMDHLGDYRVVMFGDVMLALPPKYEQLLLDWKKVIKGTELDIL